MRTMYIDSSSAQTMNRLILLPALTVLLLLIHECSVFANPSTPSANRLCGNELKVMGRFAVDGQKLELITSGAYTGVRFKGDQCVIIVSTGDEHNYIQYELDGVYQRRTRVNSGQPDSLKIATKQGQHILWIYKATEAHTGPIFIHEIIAQKVKPLNIPDAPLVEFIGNSITCGAASDASEVPCGTGLYHDQHNAYMAYGPRVARALKVNFVLSSVSGIGVYRNWNSDGPVMPAVYSKMDFRADDSRQWNFETFTPAVVSIALGTNDFSGGDGRRPRLPFDSVTFTVEYVKFVKTVKSIYPKSRIVLLNSPMVGGNSHDIFVDCLNRVKQQIDKAYPTDKPVAIFLLKPMTPRGCTYHPDTEDHNVIANQLTPLFRNLLRE